SRCPTAWTSSAWTSGCTWPRCWCATAPRPSSMSTTPSTSWPPRACWAGCCRSPGCACTRCWAAPWAHMPAPPMPMPAGPEAWRRTGPIPGSCARRTRPCASWNLAASAARCCTRWSGCSAPWTGTASATVEPTPADCFPPLLQRRPPMTSRLLSPLDLGSLRLPNRVFMAPLTRSRAGQPGDVPTELNAEYYAQRASAGLIVSEATQVSPQGKGYAWTPGMYSDAQEAGWSRVTDAVHARGGHMAAQLWHVGRISHTLLQPDGAAPVAPSPLVAEGANAFVVRPDGSAGNEPTSLPRALKLEELPGVVGQYAQAARRADRAGFDLVEVHAANGYLLQQFLSTNSNQREDQYGGSLENRARFPLEVVDAVVAQLGPDRVGV